ncbi:hypothetical protein FDH34_gp424 [Serratia phage BF]|uniref:Uncharacterized protein n=1 Tax=Serratia phage BF TaxID=1962671 RepID=A0A1S6UBC6_9CAUD|nr:hypothetical protein FDH34_gp424 [Serratia phage BF]AQW89021.1 hypothetical protein BF_0496 [Serratia phage BF]
MEIQHLVNTVKENEIKIEELRQSIKDLYEDNSIRFSEYKNTVTPEIQENYKKIDSTFTAKAKLEAEVRSLQKQILSVVLGEQ